MRSSPYQLNVHMQSPEPRDIPVAVIAMYGRQRRTRDEAPDVYPHPGGHPPGLAGLIIQAL